ncbi:phosphate acyltransferase PlsX [Wolinella succinogenes]|uniref:Phosphate acyltransferase n=1 Tax=Wolinella succinogenes (strain ATCC 29543 / DSM 1740 / CCUG 13145 / JCM 31913 / LMG 7466 / NCTC 11488 / FDC 602W) TaxID=273121 RepID=PLSX_WOLSU|nr:phosphate acyltransferase PlsX [Wolinella succinogenes]Q7M7Z4.1 RecName: Full=Phosphate acyltransferase; AltName: Full=Acyl-ACP phosphotransacylase; AltName: Full=Acyl-[acyl-carrier-protein]--phosphate acyltransferase; AltName: Full=Phosphate-acyl-ACP acyltransferase [Wolinella succinogenes DSM 1740]HCZ19047.1 phosphate acyltransferase PlsX [Helicobacter sp.]NLU33823.1 phosphate acyltransferase PlsX [Wolinella succinogenes]CAE10992.1 FATTY ACID/PHOSPHOLIPID SYNTHESIS PROTEIN [Wolinella succi
MVRVAIDAMGGDFGPAPIVEGTLLALNEKDFIPFLVGNKEIIEPLIPQKYKKTLEIIDCKDFIKMEEGASSAIRRKDSSIYVATELAKEGKVDALVSAGHSGATMSLATLRIGRIEGASRPAICAIMPRQDGKQSLILDAGANVDCKPEHLYEFALMGYEYSKNVMGYENPRIGLLSNGEEESKGNELTKSAFSRLKTLKGFVGNVEGHNIFDGSTEVIVCDGFVGNIVLKTSEGVAESITTLIKNFVKVSLTGVVGALFMKNVFKKLKKRMDYAEYGGAPLLGVNGNVIICHGKSNAKAIKNAIFQALTSVDQKINENIIKAFASHPSKE